MDDEDSIESIKKKLKGMQEYLDKTNKKLQDDSKATDKLVNDNFKFTRTEFWVFLGMAAILSFSTLGLLLYTIGGK